MSEPEEEEVPQQEEKPKMAIRIEPPEYIAIQRSLIPFFEDITDEQRDRCVLGSLLLFHLIEAQFHHHNIPLKSLCAFPSEAFKEDAGLFFSRRCICCVERWNGITRSRKICI